jgi:hypothetical protein
MDFNSMKDQLSGKAKDELSAKVDEVKQDIAKRFSGGSGGTTEATNLTGPNQTEAGTDVTGARPALLELLLWNRPLKPLGSEPTWIPLQTRTSQKKKQPSSRGST